MGYQLTRKNKNRAEMVKAVLDYIAGPDANFDDLVDLLTNARHYAAQRGYDLAEIDRLVAMHFEAEAAGEDA